MFGIVLMKVADMERFRKAVDEDPRERRALESLKSHKWFSGLYLRYTNTDTLCLNMDNTRDYAFPGIGVSIFPLRSEAESASAGRRFSRDENAWMELCHINYADRSLKNQAQPYLDEAALSGQWTSETGFPFIRPIPQIVSEAGDRSIYP